MRWIIGFFAVLTAAVAGLFAIPPTPETDFETMLSRYGGAQARFARTEDGLQVHYRDQGFAEGPAIVFVHGSSASLHTWEPLVARLGDRYRLISYDQPGHGLTGEHPDNDYTAQGMIEALDAVVATAGLDHFVLVGNSMGGWVSWRYALKNPDRLAGLVLVDAAGAPLPEGVEAPGNLAFTLLQNPLGRRALDRWTPRPLVAMSVRQSVAVKGIVTDDMVDRYWELVRLPANKRAAVLRATVDREPVFADRLPEIATPTLIIWGREDALIPIEAADVFKERIAGSELVVYDGVGHLPMEEAPDEVAALLDDWIQREASRR